MATKRKVSKKTIKQKNKERALCDLPKVPDRPIDSHIDPGRAFLIRNLEKKWVNGTVLHYYFLNSPTSWRGSNQQKEAVKKAFSVWKKLGIGLQFIEVNNPRSAEIRIGFKRGSSWSYIGRDAIDLVSDPDKRTMNFGWDLTTPYGGDTALHEIGHAMGFPHEHQNPNAGIVWNIDAVNEYFSGPPNNWDAETIQHNIIRKISMADVGGSNWDKNSIMHYQFNAGLIKFPVVYQTQSLIPEPNLSATDKKEARKFYPDNNKKLPELKPYNSKIVRLSAGQQVDYVIKPDTSRKYTMQTFGSMDTVMVLFEDDNGEPIFLAGDDDSGTDFNSEIEYRLISGRTYYLRLRLYYATRTGQGAVILW